jgi:ABC-type proline/glycine betaine transport system permease subunit
MEENDVLDDLNDQEPELPEHRQRCFRFFWYSLGIGLIMMGQIWLGSNSAEVGGYFNSIKSNYLLSLGVVGVWLFAGLGSLAGIRTIKEERPDLLLVGVLVIHILALSLSTGFLYKSIFAGG